MTPPFPQFNRRRLDVVRRRTASASGDGRKSHSSRATLLTMTPRREQHQTCSSRSSIKNTTVSTQRTREEVNLGSNEYRHYSNHGNGTYTKRLLRTLTAQTICARVGTVLSTISSTVQIHRSGPFYKPCSVTSLWLQSLSSATSAVNLQSREPSDP